MPLSLRIPPELEARLKNYAEKQKKTKSAIVLEALQEKVGTKKERSQKIREIAGWMSHEETERLRSSMEAFNRINEGDWE
jgi:predicted DNA-binding protein